MAPITIWLGISRKDLVQPVKKKKNFWNLKEFFRMDLCVPAHYSHDICSVRENSAKFFFGILQVVCPNSN